MKIENVKEGKTADAVLRNPEAIGEAVKNVPEEIGRITKRRV